MKCNPKSCTLSGNLNEHFAHGTFGQAAESGLYLFEREYAIDYGLAIDGVETADDFLPVHLGGFGGVIADGYAADTIAAEEEGAGIELRDGAGAAADDADFAAVAEGGDDLVEERAGDIVDGEVYRCGGECGLDAFGEVRVLGIKDEARRRVPSIWRLSARCGLRRRFQAHGFPEEHGGDADTTGCAGDQQDGAFARRRGRVAPLSEGLEGGEKGEGGAGHFFDRPARRHGSDAGGRDHGFLSEGTPDLDADVAAQDTDSVPGLGNGHVRADLDDVADRIAAEDVR